MTTIITIGNLTKDAEVKTTTDGRSYVLLQLAENIYQRDDNGKIIKNAEGHYQTLQTMYYSVFVNDKTGALTASKLKKGAAVKVVGRAKIKIQKDANGYDQYLIDRISATYIDTDPFKKLPEANEMATDEEVADIPL